MRAKRNHFESLGGNSDLNRHATFTEELEGNKVERCRFFEGGTGTTVSKVAVTNEGEILDLDESSWRWCDDGSFDLKKTGFLSAEFEDAFDSSKIALFANHSNTLHHNTVSSREGGEETTSMYHLENDCVQTSHVTSEPCNLRTSSCQENSSMTPTSTTNQRASSRHKRPGILSILTPAELEEELQQTTFFLAESMRRSELSRMQLVRQGASRVMLVQENPAEQSLFAISKHKVTSYIKDVSSMALG